MADVGLFAPCEHCAPKVAVGPCVVAVADVPWLTCSVCGAAQARHVTLRVPTEQAAEQKEAGR